MLSLSTCWTACFDPDFARGASCMTTCPAPEICDVDNACRLPEHSFGVMPANIPTPEGEHARAVWVPTGTIAINTTTGAIYDARTGTQINEAGLHVWIDTDRGVTALIARSITLGDGVLIFARGDHMLALAATDAINIDASAQLSSPGGPIASVVDNTGDLDWRSPYAAGCAAGQGGYGETRDGSGTGGGTGVDERAYATGGGGGGHQGDGGRGGDVSHVTGAAGGMAYEDLLLPIGGSGGGAGAWYGSSRESAGDGGGGGGVINLVAPRITIAGAIHCGGSGGGAGIVDAAGGGGGSGGKILIETKQLRIEDSAVMAANGGGGGGGTNDTQSGSPGQSGQLGDTAAAGGAGPGTAGGNGGAIDTFGQPGAPTTNGLLGTGGGGGAAGWIVVVGAEVSHIDSNAVLTPEPTMIR